MTKAELIDLVARSAHLSRPSAASAIELTFEQIARAIRRDKRFSIPDFGTFTVRRRKARRGYNPRKKAMMTIPASRTIGFRPAPKLKKGL
ncbi:MAG TPA: HU family DNA-binding protein [Candidatus Binataceae bacterium]|nr:HU family DNA-binding protein [Candidatus Binataceae bacterium]